LCQIINSVAVVSVTSAAHIDIFRSTPWP
jgi:hypothetical protein